MSKEHPVSHNARSTHKGAKEHSTERPHSAHGSNVTTDHGQIRKWVEERGGKPARVQGTGSGHQDGGLLRIDFPDYGDDQRLESLSWEEFFEKFEEKKLAFLYQDRKADEEESRFSKFVSRDRAH